MSTRKCEIKIKDMDYERHEKARNRIRGMNYEKREIDSKEQATKDTKGTKGYPWFVYETSIFQSWMTAEFGEQAEIHAGCLHVDDLSLISFAFFRVFRS